ncbi:MAG: hypothetical protein V8Q32_02405 [Anaerotignum faecicola]
MVGRIYHVGLTVSIWIARLLSTETSLRLEFQGEIFTKGEETDKMFRRAN